MSCNYVMQAAGHPCEAQASGRGARHSVAPVHPTPKRSFLDTPIRQLAAATNRPEEAVAGGLKKVLNDVISVGDLGIVAANGIGYGVNTGIAAGLDAFGLDQTAADYHARNERTFERIREFELPKATLNGDAEKGGALVVSAAETVALARVAMSLAGKGVRAVSGLLGAGDEVAEAVTARTASKADGAAGGAVGNLTIRTASIGRNEVEWHSDNAGRVVRAKAVLREVFSGLTRSSTEKAAQRSVGKSGLPSDHGGHIFDHRFVGDQGPINMFPQNGVPLGALKNFNGSAYRTMMNELSDWVKAGAEVRLDVRLGKMDASGRPGVVDVSYEVWSNDRRVYKNEDYFENRAGQVFQRMSKSEILARLAR